MSSQQPAPSRRTREQLQELYLRGLEKEGYHPELDSDGDVSFRHEGNHYFIEVREDDPMFFRVVLPNFWDVDSPEERLRIVEAANYANGEIAIAKVFIVRASTWSAVELFIPEQEQFAAILQRCLLTIRECVTCFSEHMRNEINRPKDADDAE